MAKVTKAQQSGTGREEPGPSTENRRGCLTELFLAFACVAFGTFVFALYLGGLFAVWTGGFALAAFYSPADDPGFYPFLAFAGGIVFSLAWTLACFVFAGHFSRRIYGG